MVGVFDDFGIRFEYPPGWVLDVSEEGARRTVSLDVPGGTAFALVTLDEDRPEPADLVDEALDAMRAEYPGLEETAAREVLDGHPAVGHDLSFLSLDMVAACAIRGFRTPRRTIFFFGQWTDLDDADIEGRLRTLRGTIAETDR